MNDIVYILKDDVTAEELRYSLRSVCENFPYRKVWIYGGKPDGIEPDEYVPFNQRGTMPWEKVISTIKEVCRNKDITNDFWLFNDDFYIIQKVEPVNYYDRTLFRRIQQIEKNRGGARSLYSQMLRRTREALQSEGYKTFNYEVHMPMLINRTKAYRLIEKYPKMVMFRSTYGNVYDIGGEQHKDMKIANPELEPPEDCDYLSTADGDLSESNVGRFIMGRFPTPCRYEV